MAARNEARMFPTFLATREPFSEAAEALILNHKCPLEYRPSRALAWRHWLCSSSKQDPSNTVSYRSTT